MLRNMSRLPDRVNNLLYYQIAHQKSVKVNVGQLQAEANSTKAINNLREVEFQVFSQFGDDGIIQWIISRIAFPFKTFIEFGVENYQEANTRFLLVNNYWSGLVIDGSREHIDGLKQERIYTAYDLQAKASFITAENINGLLTSSGFPKELGILSIDIDGNDYWVWSAIDTFDPVLVICEYNALFGFDAPLTIQYNPEFVRGTQYPFNYYGASLRSLYDLARRRDYSFIGCNSAGNNAYFLKNTYMQQSGIKALTPEEGYVFASFTEAWDETAGDWKKGPSKISHLRNLPVFNTRTGMMETFDPEAVILSLQSKKLIPRL